MLTAPGPVPRAPTLRYLSGMHDLEPVLETYRARVERFVAERDDLANRSRRLSWARMAMFVAAIAFLVRAELVEESRAAFLLGGLVSLVIFFGLVIRHGRIKRSFRRAEALVMLNEEGSRRIARDWDHLPGADFGPIDPRHPYAIDLDVFGHASLFQLVGGVVGTAPGRATLANWLLTPAPPESIRLRQQAVTELAPRIELRDEFAIRGRLQTRTRPDDVARFLEWAEDEPWLSHRPALLWATRILAAANLALATADLFGWIERPFWILTVLAGLALTTLTRSRIYGIFGRAFSREGAFRSYDKLFRLIAETPFETTCLLGIQRSLTTDGEPAHHRMRRLERIMELADLRRSGMFHFPVHALTLWDFHVLYALERWQRESGHHARAWLDALGEFDALAGLATLAHDHPDWTFPDIAEDDVPIVKGHGLGHPLLPPDVRVDNDVTVGPPGTVLLVTGSNMSGKSTLLRTIGCNIVLAQAGGPVCARALRLSPVAVWTSMRVQDSLSRGVSYFMAELQRLKQVVDAARDRTGGRRTVLYLLDEILHGTNTAERQIAAQRVIRYLVDRGAIGVVSTHDLALTQAPELQEALRNVHLTESVSREDGRMTLSFDYKLREGVASSTNALKLMEIVGLGELSDRP